MGIWMPYGPVCRRTSAVKPGFAMPTLGAQNGSYHMPLSEISPPKVFGGTYLKRAVPVSGRCCGMALKGAGRSRQVMRDGSKALNGLASGANAAA